MKMEFLRRLLNFSIILCLLENIGYSSNIRLIESEFTCIHCCQQSWFFQFFDNFPHVSIFFRFSEYLQTYIYFTKYLSIPNTNYPFRHTNFSNYYHFQFTINPSRIHIIYPYVFPFSLPSMRLRRILLHNVLEYKFYTYVI